MMRPDLSTEMILDAGSWSSCDVPKRKKTNKNIEIKNVNAHSTIKAIHFTHNSIDVPTLDMNSISLRCA